MLVLVMICAHGKSFVQGPEATKPPALLNTAGNFRVARVPGEPVLDGREWIVANVQTTSEATVFRYRPGNSR
jgi:hypothetical protein